MGIDRGEGNGANVGSVPASSLIMKASEGVRSSLTTGYRSWATSAAGEVMLALAAGLQALRSPQSPCLHWGLCALAFSPNPGAPFTPVSFDGLLSLLHLSSH